MSALSLSRRHAIGLTLAAGAVSLPALAKSDDVARTIDGWAKDAIRSGATPGLQLAVQKGNRQILSGGYGIANVEFAAPVRADTAFRIGSVTKQFTGAALLRLHEEGRLSPDDALAKYYPDFPRAAEVTLRQMAQHISGIHGYTEEPNWLDDVMLRRDADASAAYFAKLPKLYDFEPGTSWHYSNSTYILLGGVIEKATGQSLAEVLRTRFFDPLGMTHTAIDDERVLVPGRAAGYDKLDSGAFANAGFVSVIATGGAGSIRSTAADLVRWNQGLFGGKVLRAASLQAMMTPARLTDGTMAQASKTSAGVGYGYGVRLADDDGRRTVSHGGWIHGFRSQVLHVPEQALTVVLLANCGTKQLDMAGLTRKIEALLV